jgi:DNA (cytosine-5)-methyltransferase 1
MNELALFAGAGGGILGGHLLGWRTVCAVEWEEYPASVLCARQNDGLLPPFPIWDDVQTFDGKPWRGIVDVVSGGFPCQDISAAGRGGGIEAERSGMWKEMARIIGEVRPKYAFVENSPMLTSRGLGTVLADLAQMGFDAEWGVLSATDVGANHKRERIWIVAKISNSKCKRWTKGNDAELETYQTKWSSSSIPFKSSIKGLDRNSWKTEPNICRVVNGMASAMDRLKAIGNGQVPLCAATAWELLTERLNGRN